MPKNSILQKALSIAIAGRDCFMRCEQAQFEKKFFLSSYSVHSTGPHGAYKRKEDIMTGHIISTCGTIKGQYKAAHGGTQVWYHCKHL